MSSNDRLCEREAVLFAGVSAATLGRFAETGYLNVEIGADGDRFFSRSQIGKLFGIDPADAWRQNPPLDKTAGDTGSNGCSKEAEENYTEEVQQPHASETEPAQDTQDLERPVASPRLKQLEREVRRLRNLQSLQERLLEIRERELDDIKNERDWLKRRIERLEEKSDREQLILLHETQTIRSLIASREEKRSPLRYALEWLGFAAPIKESSSTIEVSRSSSEGSRHDNVYRMSSNG
jgi:hypothetical protein